MELRQSTSQVIRFGPFADSTDGVTPETGLTITQADMQLSKDGGAFAQKNAAGNAVHDVDGYYFTTLDVTDTDTTAILKLQVTVAGSVLVWESYQVVTQTYYDAKYSGTYNNLSAAQVNTECDTALADYDGPTNAELIARTIVSANYATSSSLSTVDSIVDAILVDTNELQTNQGDWITATGFNTVTPPSVAQFNARTLLSADYFNPATDAVANVTLVDTTTTNTDMVSEPDNAGIAQTQADIAALNDITVANIFAGGDVDGYSLEEALKLMLSASVGVLSGAATNSVVIKAADNSKTRITATVDPDGNRSVVVKDVTG